ncbi:MAG: tryptophan 7-halogenase, partial [Planctomycetaceae bacterium]
MIPDSVDVAILGSGFAGSLTALILNRIGLSVVLLERGTHPRFAIGESSTPAADFILADLVQKYGLTALEPLTSYGTWRAQRPELVCGLKRGFSYFKHTAGQPFAAAPHHRNELLVAASATDEHADTHWLRADVDHFMCGQVQTAGIPYVDQVEMHTTPVSTGWSLDGHRSEGPVHCTARFVIDATGAAGILPRTLNIANRSSQCSTQSRAIFGHFQGVAPWRDIIGPDACFDYPFACDNGALHHILDDGWMWQLRFDNGITSAGFCLNTVQYPLDSNRSVQAEWHELLASHPSIARQFGQARCIGPQTGIVRTKRLQRRWASAAGQNWALLPHTAGFIDPLHSTGIAHALIGVERLTHILESHWDASTLSPQLDYYSRSINRELDLIDRLVQVCYCSMRDFDLFVPCSMLYFTCAIAWEHRRSSSTSLRPELLCADDMEINAMVDACLKKLRSVIRSPNKTAPIPSAVANRFRADI